MQVDDSTRRAMSVLRVALHKSWGQSALIGSTCDLSQAIRESGQRGKDSRGISPPLPSPPLSTPVPSWKQFIFTYLTCTSITLIIFIRVFRKSPISKKLPTLMRMPMEMGVQSYSILADKGFPLSREVMTPYRGKPHKLTPAKRKFGRHLNTKRQVYCALWSDLPSSKTNLSAILNALFFDTVSWTCFCIAEAKVSKIEKPEHALAWKSCSCNNGCLHSTQCVHTRKWQRWLLFEEDSSPCAGEIYLSIWPHTIDANPVFPQVACADSSVSFQWRITLKNSRSGSKRDFCKNLNGFCFKEKISPLLCQH